MELPFTAPEFFEVFRRYNEAVWPAQLLLYLLALLPFGFALRDPTRARRLALLVLSALWLWMGVAYHWSFFAAINPAAKGFAILFVIAALLFGRAAFRREASMGASSKGTLVISAVLILYALVGYPAAGLLAGHRFPSMPTFGLPCPTTIFTIGLLTLFVPRASRTLLAIPILWSVVGSTAAFRLGVPEDYGLALAGVWGLVLLSRRGGGRKAHAGTLRSPVRG